MGKKLPTATPLPTADLDDITDAIKRIATGVRKLQAAGATDRLLVVLIHDATGGRNHGVSHKAIERVLAALPQLSKLYLSDPEDE